MKKTPSIPAVAVAQPEIASVLGALKKNVEFTAGVSAPKLAKLGLTASLSDVINLLNKVVDRLQGEQ